MALRIAKLRAKLPSHRRGVSMIAHGQAHGNAFAVIGAAHARKKRYKMHLRIHHVFKRLRRTKRVDRARTLLIRRIQTFQARG